MPKRIVPPAARRLPLRQIFARYKLLALLLAVVVIWTFFSVLTDGAFVTPRNVSNLLRQMSITGMLACGMVFVIIAGEIDLSVGSLLGCSAASRRSSTSTATGRSRRRSRPCSRSAC